MVTEKRYTPKQLSSMRLKSLEGVGGELGLKFNSHHKIADRARRILQVYADRDIASASEASAESSESIENSRASSGPVDRKPEFERLCRHAIDQPADDVPSAESSQHGGDRPGSGRPPGMTDELSLYNRLPQQPHPTIQHLLELAFDAWAAKTECPEIALSKDQAIALALPWTQAAYLAGVLDYIPAWAMVVIECTWVTYSMVSVKAEIAREAMVNRKEVKSREVKSDG